MKPLPEEVSIKSKSQWNVLDEVETPFEEHITETSHEPKTSDHRILTSSVADIKLQRPSQWGDGEFSEIISSDEEKVTHEITQDRMMSSVVSKKSPMKPQISIKESIGGHPLDAIPDQQLLRDPIHSKWFSMNFDWSREVAKALKV